MKHQFCFEKFIFGEGRRTLNLGCLEYFFRQKDECLEVASLYITPSIMFTSTCSFKKKNVYKYMSS